MSQYLFAADERVSFLATETDELWLAFLLPVLPLVMQDIEIASRRLGWPREKNIEEHKVLQLHPKIVWKPKSSQMGTRYLQGSSPSVQDNHPGYTFVKSLNLGSWRPETRDTKTGKNIFWEGAALLLCCQQIHEVCCFPFVFSQVPRSCRQKPSLYRKN